jgi:hypothetical protein
MGKSAQRAVTGFNFAAQRRGMIERHIAARGVRSVRLTRGELGKA